MAEAAKIPVAAEVTDAAEKAYAAASEQVVVKPVAENAPEAAAVKPVVAKVETPAPVATKPVEAKPVEAKPVEAKPVLAEKAAKTPKVKAAVAKPVVEAPAKRKYVRKAPVAAKQTVAKPVVAAKAKPVAAKAVKAKPAKITTTPSTLITKLKETKMATTTQKTADDFTAKVQDTVKDVQARAKTAFAKSQAMFGNVGEFTKGNLEAMVESGKILATGVQAMGKTYVAEVKSSIEAVQADAKELRTVKSPTDFMKLQSTLIRKYFDNVVAYNSKSAEAALKLANEAFQPISNRVSLAVEKVKKAA